MAKTYKQLLLDPRWQKKRLEVLEAANWECEECGDNEETLHVHHKIYRKGANPWEYSNSELMCLCSSCHEEIHQIKNRFNEAAAKLHSTDLERVIGYMKALSLWNDESGDERISVDSFADAEGISDAFGITEIALFDSVDEDKSIGLKELQEASSAHYNALAKAGLMGTPFEG